MTTDARYRVRVIGSRYDYIRRYSVLDTATGRRVDNVRGGLIRDEAQDLADDMNGVVR